MIWVRILVPVPSDQQLTMVKVYNYFRESYHELLEKVTWPTWNELQQSTLVVLAATLIITGLVWVMDLISQSLLKFIYSFFA